MVKGTFTFIIALLLLAITAVIKVSFLSVTFSADILATLPTEKESVLVDAENAFSKALSNKIIISVDSKNTSDAKRIYDELKKDLKEYGIRIDQTTNDSLSTLANIYAAHSYTVMSWEFEQALTSSRNMQRYFLHYLSQTSSPFVSETIDLDPTLATAGYLTELVLSNRQFILDDQRLIIYKDAQPIFFIVADVPPNRVNDTRYLEGIVSLVNTMGYKNPTATLRYSGASFHNAENTALAKSETSFFGIISLFVVALLLFYSLRTWRAIILAHCSILVSLISGISAVIITFTDIHVLSFVFGITLVGIAIDYCLHKLVHSSKSNANQRSLNRAITYGFITTALGYISFFFTSVPLLKQVAVFVISGLTAAWLFTLFVIPQWISSHAVVLNPNALRMSECIRSFFNQLGSHKLIITLGITTLSILWTLISPTLNADIRQLNASSTLLKNNESAHFSMINGNESRFLIVAADFEEALQLEEAIMAASREIEPRATFNGLSQWLPSQQQQQQQYDKITHAIKAGVFSEVNAYLASPVSEKPFIPLTLSSFNDTYLTSLADMHLYESKSHTVLWMGISGLSQDQHARLIARFSDNLQPFNKLQRLNTAMQTLLNHLVWVVIFAATVICVLVGVLEGAALAVKSALLLIIICGFSLLLSYCIDSNLGVFSLLGMLLLLALSADYFIFYAINKHQVETQYAISLSAATSMAVFGILTFSQTPAIHSLGLIMMLGILFISFFAPIIVRESS